MAMVVFVMIGERMSGKRGCPRQLNAFGAIPGTLARIAIMTSGYYP